jgi:cytochrome c oxidase subunit 2
VTAVLQAITQFPGAHSVLAPAGPQARMAESLWNPMYAVAIVVYMLVMGALFWATFRRRRADEPTVTPQRERTLRRVVTGATVATTVVLFVFLVLNVSVGRAVTAHPGENPIQLRVTGHQWWWEVQYRDSVPQRWVTTANEIHVPVGRPVVVELRSSDVIHSFWPPNLSGKHDLIPGNENSFWFQADSAGVYRTECAEFCGHQHAKMSLLVVAQHPDSFAQWLTQQRDTARTPTDTLALRGRAVFLGSSCVMCHAIAGTPAGSRVGPDLTHLASRATIAAGTLPNTPGNLAGWIVDPQRIKPGVLMPPNQLDPEQLQALLAYLETLR